MPQRDLYWCFLIIPCKLPLYSYLTTYHLKISKQSLKMCIMSSATTYNGHLPLLMFLLIPLNCHTSASCHTTPFLSFLEPHSIYRLLPQQKFISQCSVNELFSNSFAKIFYLSTSLHLISLSLLFLSSYTLRTMSKQMLIQYYTVLLSIP